MKQKNLNKRIRRLEARLAKDTRKLAKLRQKLSAASKRSTEKEKPVESPAPTKTTSLPAAASKKKKKRQLSPEGRAKLASMMKERWAAKKAAALAPVESPTEAPVEAGSPS